MGRVRSITKQVLLAFALMALCAAAAHADNRAGDVTMGVSMGLADFSGSYDYHDSSVLGLSLGYNIDEALTAELSGGFASTNEDTVPGSTSDATVSIYRVEALYHVSGLFGDTNILPFFAAGCGAMSFKSDRPGTDTDRNFIVSAGGGIKYSLSDGYALRGDLREIVDVEDIDHPTCNALMSVAFMLSFGSPPEKVETVEPEAPYVEEAIPVEKKPEEKPPAPVVKEPVDGDGDEDGVPDSRDKCPHTPKGVKVDANGCPEPEKAVITSRGTYDFGVILFDFGKATLKRGSWPLLNNVAAHMKKYPDVKLEVQGHTDSVGKAAYNKKLSGARAAAVKKYLTGKGIQPSRLTSKGFGMSSPIAPNKTKAGRARNRRTEFMPIW